MLIWFMLFLYILLGVYILWRLIHWLKKVIPFFKHKRMQAVIVVVYICFAMTLILGGLLLPSGFQRFLMRIGNIWLGTFIYILMNILIVDIAAIILKIINRRKELPMMKRLLRYYVTGVAVVISSVVFSTMGLIHANHIKLNTYDINIDKSVDGMDTMNIVMVADLHLGYNSSYRQMERMVSMINGENPDLVVFAGDIFDNNYDAVMEPERLTRLFAGIESKYGVYAVFGNHDVAETLIGGFSVSSEKYAFRDERMVEFLKESNITVLEDETVNIAGNDIILIGRVDYKKAGNGTSDRASIEKLTEKLDKSKVIIDLEHQPVGLSRAAGCGVDLMLSGHTHGGQFFPLTVVQPFAWENYWGVKKTGGMISIVTSGVGVYGPDMRVFTDSEVVSINVHFK
ncbi:MAG: metallophosphoesterase [Eubacteriales bacterium]|nr:metallophosphoesterase [Eubacteriales bacterium]